MAEIKISELTSGSALSGTEVVPIVQSGATVKVTTQDIADLGGGTNPTSTYIPYNNAGTFANSGFNYSAVYGLDTLTHKDSSSATNLKLDSVNFSYSFGAASSSFGSVSASYGIGIDSSNEAIISCGIGSTTNGEFRASGANGAIWIGSNGIGYGIGYNTMFNSIFIGTSLITNTGSYTQTHWAAVNDEMGNTYYLPLYT